MTPKEALEYLKNRITTLSLNHKIGNRDIAKLEVKDIVMGIETHVMPIFEKALTELEELKRHPTSKEMITHEEARNLLNELVPTDAITPSQIDDLHIYITEQQAKDKVHDELVRDVKRYFETTDMVEWSELGTKLSKVGKNDDK